MTRANIVTVFVVDLVVDLFNNSAMYIFQDQL